MPRHKATRPTTKLTEDLTFRELTELYNEWVRYARTLGLKYDFKAEGSMFVSKADGVRIIRDRLIRAVDERLGQPAAATSGRRGRRRAA